MTEKERIEYAKKAIDLYKKLDRTNCDLADWVAIKLSCGRKRAEKLIEKARGAK